MEASSNVLYIVVVDDDGRSFRYTRSLLQSTLQLMGCKPRHAFKISRTVYEQIRNKCSAEDSFLHDTRVLKSEASKYNFGKVNGKIESGRILFPSAEENTVSSIPFEFYKKRTTAVVTRETFLKVVCDALSQYKYIGPNQRADLVLACRIRERKESVTILLCGTSGCGKSTLSSLLGSRLGITTVISTDSVRHMMRSFVDEKQNPLLWASTYHAGECLDPVAVAEAKAKRKAKKLAGISGSFLKGEVPDTVITDKYYHLDSRTNETELVSERQMAIEGYKAQSEMVIDSLDRLISTWEDRKESVIVEGVHLSINFVMGLMKKHPSIVPFMIYIANEDKHMERFAVRAKYMTLDPKKNKYVKYIRNIRAIQEYLCGRADKHLVPKINNTNVDRSVAAIHATVFSCLRRREAREVLYDPTTNTVPILDEEYRKQCAANSMSSKGMFKLIQRQGSSRHLMALVNSDGSVSKAWPVEPAYSKPGLVSIADGDNSLKGPIYGPLQIGKVETVNLQFGSFGISAWPSDTGGTSSYTGSVDESKADVSDTGTRYFSSRFSSPSTSDEPAKELKDDISVSVSEEEADDLPDEGSPDDQSDLDNEMVDGEVEGSVDEGSIKSDEEFEDFTMQDDAENGYCSDDDDEKSKNITKLTNKKKLNSDCTKMTFGDKLAQRYQEDPELFGKANEESCHSTSLLTSGNWRSFSSRMKRHVSGNSLRFDRRFLSFPAFGKSKF